MNNGLKNIYSPEAQQNIWLINVFCAFLIFATCFYLGSYLYFLIFPVFFLKYPRKTAEFEKEEIAKIDKAKKMTATNSADIEDASKKLSCDTILKLLRVHNVVISLIFESNADVNGLLFSASGSLSHPSLTRRLTYTPRFAC
jgi:hypothetical protein